jgi:hypothetical protein
VCYNDHSGPERTDEEQEPHPEEDEVATKTPGGGEGDVVHPQPLTPSLKDHNTHHLPISCPGSSCLFVGGIIQPSLNVLHSKGLSAYKQGSKQTWASPSRGWRGPSLNQQPSFSLLCLQASGFSWLHPANERAQNIHICNLSGGQDVFPGLPGAFTGAISSLKTAKQAHLELGFQLLKNKVLYRPCISKGH